MQTYLRVGEVCGQETSGTCVKDNPDTAQGRWRARGMGARLLGPGGTGAPGTLGMRVAEGWPLLGKD